MCCNDIVQVIADKIGNRRRFLVAFSGGVDSTVLLHVLVCLRAQRLADMQLRAVYIHHGLSRFADRWAAHCAALCERWQVELKVIHVEVDASKSGVEAGARQARYQAISRVIQSDEALLTAQHLDDQCETFLLALKRGSGPAGLASMAEETEFAGQRHLRPMLTLSRQRIEAYAKQADLQWIEDESNQDDRFDRNFLRLNVLPAIASRWPHFSSMVARSASLCAAQEALLDELLVPLLNEIMFDDGAIDIEKLRSFSAHKRNAILRRWFAQQRVSMPSQEQLQTLWHSVALSKPDAEPVLQLGEEVYLRRYRQKLYLLPHEERPGEVVLPWGACATLMLLPGKLGRLRLAQSGFAVRAPAQEEAVTVRFSVPGSLRVKIAGRRHRRPLKKLWQELNIPPWLRQTTPLLFYGETLIAAIGLFVTDAGAPNENGAVWFIQHETLGVN